MGKTNKTKKAAKKSVLVSEEKRAGLKKCAAVLNAMEANGGNYAAASELKSMFDQLELLGFDLKTDGKYDDAKIDSAMELVNTMGSIVGL